MGQDNDDKKTFAIAIYDEITKPTHSIVGGPLIRYSKYLEVFVMLLAKVLEGDFHITLVIGVETNQKRYFLIMCSTGQYLFLKIAIYLS